MQKISWEPVEQISPSRAAEARRHAHNAVHWLARAAHSYLDPEADNRHVELLWSADDAAIVTKTFAEKLTVQLRLDALELQFCENGEPVPHALSFEERTPAHVEAWFLVELLHRDVDRDRFSKDLPYAAKDLMLGDHEDHEVEAYAAELSALHGWFRNGAALALALRGELAKEGLALAPGDPLTVWPQNFQLGFSCRAFDDKDAPALRVGLSAGDALRAEPFFFVATPEQAAAADFDAAGILSVQRIPREGLSADDVLEFLRGAVAAQRKRASS